MRTKGNLLNVSVDGKEWGTTMNWMVCAGRETGDRDDAVCVVMMMFAQLLPSSSSLLLLIIIRSLSLFFFPV